MAQADFLRGHLLRSTKEPNPIAPAMLASRIRMTARGAFAGESVWSSPAFKQGGDPPSFSGTEVDGGKFAGARFGYCS